MQFKTIHEKQYNTKDKYYTILRLLAVINFALLTYYIKP